MKIVWIIFLLFWSLGCSVKYHDVKLSSEGEPMPIGKSLVLQRKISALKKMLTDINDSVDQKEAADLAKRAVLYPHLLADRYRLVSPPNLQNFLINIGLREKGFCYHWMFDLGKMLKKRGYKTMDLYYAVAYYDTIREHNAVVVTAKGDSFVNGVVLDAWRNSGELYFAPLSRDDYPWKMRRPIE